MRETVEAFVKARDEILKFAKAPPPTAVEKSPKRKAAKMDGADEDFQESKRPRRSARSASARGKAQEEDITEDLEEGQETEDEYIPEPGMLTLPHTRACDTQSLILERQRTALSHAQYVQNE